MFRVNKLSAVLIAFLYLNQILVLGYNFEILYYAIIGLISFLLFSTNFKVKLNHYVVLILIAAVISIIFNDIPAFFQVELRLIAFVVVVSLIGPLMINHSFEIFRFSLFRYINGLLIIVLVVSAIGILGRYTFVIGRGGWAGLFGHSMLLGPIAMIVLILAVEKGVNCRNVMYRWAWVGIAVLAFISGIAAGSRSALAAGVAGLIFYYYKKNQGELSKFIGSILVAVALIAVTFPIWGDYTGFLIQKMEYAEDRGDYFVTRSAMWEIRTNEFLSSPITGVGFAAVDTDISTKFDTDSGRVEPGTSWLVILSMTGILGFIPFILLCYSSYSFLLDKENQLPMASLLGALLTFFMVHMLAEGYVFSAGSGLFFYFWLVMGLIEHLKKDKNLDFENRISGY